MKAIYSRPSEMTRLFSLLNPSPHHVQGSQLCPVTENDRNNGGLRYVQ